MEIKSLVSQPYDRAVSPGIKFDIEMIYSEQAILTIGGWLKTDDQKILSPILLEKYDSSQYTEITAQMIGVNASVGKTYKNTFISLFDKTCLAYIEERRLTNQKHDVMLNIELLVKAISSEAVISNIHAVDHGSLGLTDKQLISDTRTPLPPSANLLANAYVQNFRPQRGDLWLISGNGGPRFLGLFEQVLTKEIRIPATDWIHDYAPILGLGHYFVVEVPLCPNNIPEAWKYIENAEDCFRKWDSKGVYANCREVGVLLDDTVKNKFGKDSFVYKVRWGRSFHRWEHASFKDVASVDLHLEDLKKSYPADEVHIGKNDVEHVLIITKALVKYSAELLTSDS